MTILLRSPHPFPERLLLFGGGGAGKSEAVLNIARHMAPPAHMHIYDNDVSFSYNRALATTYRDVDEVEKVTVHEVTNEWQNTLEVVGQMVLSQANEDNGDWIVLDSITPTWQQVQSWYLEQVYGDDAATYMIQLKAQHGDDTEGYSKALADAMNWDIVNREYNRLYNLLFTWKGNLIVCAEAAQLGKREGAEESMLFGHLGFKPGGQKRLHFIASTNIMLVHKNRQTWTMSTAKDRNREDMENEEVENFALDYLVPYAGWKPMPVKKAAKAADA